jgi:hypothetical protein
MNLKHAQRNKIIADHTTGQGKKTGKEAPVNYLHTPTLF